MISLKEPKRWQDFLIAMNQYVRNHYMLKEVVPITADIFVFSYPIFLVSIYLWWLYKYQEEYNIWAIYIFFSTVVSILINLILQHFIYKLRPEQLVLTQKDLIFSHVPDRPFPSDHAAVSSAVAMATLLWWIKTNNKFFIGFWVIFWIFAFIMDISRIAAGVHWPTDILAGIFVGVGVALILNWDFVFVYMKQYLYIPLYNLSKLIFRI